MANFCTKCGSRIDQTTGLCPKCSAQAGAAPVAEPVIEQAAPAVEPVIEQAAPAVEPVIGQAAPVVESVIGQAAPAVEPVIEQAAPVAEPVIEQAAPAAEPVIEQAAPAVEPVIEQAAPAVEPVIEQAAPAAEPVIEQAAPVVAPVIEQAAPAVEPVIEQAAPVAEPVIEQAAPAAEPVIEQAAPAVEPVIEQAAPQYAPQQAAPQYAPQQYPPQYAAQGAPRQYAAPAPAAVPAKKKSRVGRTIVAVFLFITFIFTSLFFVVLSVTRSILSERMGFAIVDQMAVLGTEALANGNKDIADDLNSKYGYDVNDDTMTELLASDSMKELLGEKFEDMGEVIFDGKIKDIVITRDEIVDLVMDNKGVLKGKVDHKITEDDAYNIANEVTGGSESITLIEAAEFSEDREALNVVGFFLSKTNIIILGAVSLVLIALIILCRPGLGYIGCGVVTLVWSLPLLAGGIIAIASPGSFMSIVDTVGVNSKNGVTAIVAVLTGILRANLILSGALCIGAVLLIVVGAILAKKLKKRRA